MDSIIQEAYLNIKKMNITYDLKEWQLLDELFKIEIKKQNCRFFKIIIYLSKIETNKAELYNFIFYLNLLKITKEHNSYNQLLEAYKNTYHES